MPRGKSSNDGSVVSLWYKTSSLIMTEKGSSYSPPLETSEPPLITQDYLAQFLKYIKQEIGSLRVDFKTCLQDLQRDITEVGTRVDDLEHTMDSRMEDQKVLIQLVMALENQYGELQAKQKALKMAIVETIFASAVFHETQRKITFWSSLETYFVRPGRREGPTTCLGPRSLCLRQG
ncbi:hypothetical protein NDU88_011483 [Pleurodeles waltl]|uniref:Uncharacterized protein n=1 Tax=Pleurodeles waltl TaxID=8319 RepID=A0AAV7PYK1_PLEWA|nr:hypothetical protein NDU88_011480 [Pleurodeles waltl]KAJ1133186.1 hypothetical protein NDU88_011483 [Pleurodeles waltl]